jgi:hypothetical protein
MNRAPLLRRRELAPRREVGAYASFKKLASGVLRGVEEPHVVLVLVQGSVVAAEKLETILGKILRKIYRQF